MSRDVSTIEQLKPLGDAILAHYNPARAVLNSGALQGKIPLASGPASLATSIFQKHKMQNVIASDPSPLPLVHRRKLSRRSRRGTMPVGGEPLLYNNSDITEPIGPEMLRTQNFTPVVTNRGAAPIVASMSRPMSNRPSRISAALQRRKESGFETVVSLPSELTVRPTSTVVERFASAILVTDPGASPAIESTPFTFRDNRPEAAVARLKRTDSPAASPGRVVEPFRPSLASSLETFFGRLPTGRTHADLPSIPELRSPSVLRSAIASPAWSPALNASNLAYPALIAGSRASNPIAPALESAPLALHSSLHASDLRTRTDEMQTQQRMWLSSSTASMILHRSSLASTSRTHSGKNSDWSLPNTARVDLYRAPLLSTNALPLAGTVPLSEVVHADRSHADRSIVQEWSAGTGGGLGQRLRQTQSPMPAQSSARPHLTARTFPSFSAVRPSVVARFLQPSSAPLLVGRVLPSTATAMPDPFLAIRGFSDKPHETTHRSSREAVSGMSLLDRKEKPVRVAADSMPSTTPIFRISRSATPISTVIDSTNSPPYERAFAPSSVAILSRMRRLVHDPRPEHNPLAHPRQSEATGVVQSPHPRLITRVPTESLSAAWLTTPQMSFVRRAELPLLSDRVVSPANPRKGVTETGEAVLSRSVLGASVQVFPQPKLDATNEWSTGTLSAATFPGMMVSPRANERTASVPPFDARASVASNIIHSAAFPLASSVTHGGKTTDIAMNASALHNQGPALDSRATYLDLPLRRLPASQASGASSRPASNVVASTQFPTLIDSERATAVVHRTETASAPPSAPAHLLDPLPSPATSNTAESGAQGSKPLDIEALAEKIERQILRHLAIESERKGITPWR